MELRMIFYDWLKMYETNKSQISHQKMETERIITLKLDACYPDEKLLFHKLMHWIVKTFWIECRSGSNDHSIIVPWIMRARNTWSQYVSGGTVSGTVSEGRERGGASRPWTTRDAKNASIIPRHLIKSVSVTVQRGAGDQSVVSIPTRHIIIQFQAAKARKIVNDN